MTLYLKYRPQKISELDIEKVRESLLIGPAARQAKFSDMPHAFCSGGQREQERLVLPDFSESYKCTNWAKWRAV
jgi:hypothetical protein